MARESKADRLARLAEENLRAQDAKLGKVRRDVYDNGGGTPIRRNELVRVTGIGTGKRKLRFHEYVEGPGYEYITLRDTYQGKSGSAPTGQYRSVRPDQVSRCRRQK